MSLLTFGDLQPDDPFFGQDDYAVFCEECVASSRYDKRRQRVRDKFLALHDVLYPEIQRRDWNLHPHWHTPNIVSTWYIGRVAQIWFMKLRYLRSREDVRALEELMGVPAPLDYTETQYTKHPMIDVRIDNKFIAVELLVTAWAWWDAQNFKSKVERYDAERQQFIQMLRELGHDYVFGGWPDTQKPELITTAAELADGFRAWHRLAAAGHLVQRTRRFSPAYGPHCQRGALLVCAVVFRVAVSAVEPSKQLSQARLSVCVSHGRPPVNAITNFSIAVS